MTAKRKQQKQVRGGKRMVVRETDGLTRDRGQTRIGGAVKALTPFDPATQDQGKVRFGGAVTFLPKD